MALLGRIYRSDFHVDFVGRRRVWYAVSGIIIVICAVSMIFRGFTLGIEFSGGAVFQLPSHGGTVEQVEQTLSSVGIDPADGVVQQLETSKQFRVQTPTLSDAQTDKLTDALAKRFSVANPDRDIAVSTVGSSWGSTITKKAIQGLVVFLVLVMIYLSVRFEWKMAAAAMAALVHDLVVTMGVYSIVGFEVTPSTVIAVLTILGFSLYDTVVVFDRVRENTAGIATANRRTYAEATNDALNETLVRSLNTSLIALIPVASLLFVGAGLLGAGTLKDLALAQFVGIASGTYSSLFFATPLLVDLKRGEPAVRALDARVARERGKRARAAESTPAGPGTPGGTPARGETASDEVVA
ncbi:protein translocase subunit SecF, partial [Frankia sp. AiPs1]|uniref:protein translocase subunit SecF n=1 Tax=Frankia sp. AiPs1 TaxID=573493 RepID=UPI00204486B7